MQMCLSINVSLLGFFCDSRRWEPIEIDMNLNDQLRHLTINDFSEF